MADPNLTKSENIEVKAREIDFVTRFARNWEHLREILGILRPIKKQPGYVLKSKSASVVLQDGNIAEGENIPYSKATVVETPYEEMTVEKYSKAVSLEAIKDHGYEVAVQMTDDAFLFELQTNVTERFYKYLNTGTLTLTESTWQRALAMAKGSVINKFKRMHRTATNIVGFVNVMDLYDYLGDKDIIVQNEFGFQYVTNFLGYSTVFLLSEEEIPRGRVIATPVENIVNYYVDPASSDFSRAGLSYTTDGETNLIGFHTQGNYNTAVSECFAIMGMTLFAEYIDAIAVATVNTNGGDKMASPATSGNLSDKYGSAFTGTDVSTLVEKDFAIKPTNGTNYVATGTVKKKEGFTAFSKNTDENTGHFIPVLLPDAYDTKNKTYYQSNGEAKVSTDNGCVYRVDKFIEQKKHLIIEVEDGPTYDIDPSELTLEGGIVKAKK